MEKPPEISGTSHLLLFEVKQFAHKALFALMYRLMEINTQNVDCYVPIYFSILVHLASSCNDCIVSVFFSHFSLPLSSHKY